MGWSEGRAAATVFRYGPPAFEGCMTMISAFQFDNNGQNIQFTGQKFMLFPEWNTFAARLSLNHRLSPTQRVAVMVDPATTGTAGGGQHAGHHQAPGRRNAPD